MVKANYDNNSTEYLYVHENSLVDTSAMVEAPSTKHGVQIASGRRSKRDGAIEGAVYSHIRAVRALGRTNINTTEIADALSLDLDEVNRAVARLRKKGVRGI